MSEPTVSAMMLDLIATLKAEVPELGDRITYGPPNAMPAQTSAWVEYGPVGIEWGNFEVCLHQVRIVVVTPDNGSDYLSRYRLITDYAQRLRHATRMNYVLADEAVLVQVGQGATSAGKFYESPCVQAIVTLVYETKTDLVSVIQA